MSAIPSYSTPCLAPDATGTNVYLVGVPASSEGRLEVTLVNLANLNSPTGTLIGTQTAVSFWSSSAQKTCFPYGGNQASTNNPVFVAQFGPQSYFTNAYPNGTIDLPANFPSVGLVSNKLFSLSGAVGGLNWVTALSNATAADTNSPWTGLRFNATSIVSSSRDFVLTNYPTSNPLLSVGTYVASSNTPAQGYHIVFDSPNHGSLYTTLDSAAPIVSSVDRILSLSSPQSVDMSGIVLTSNAFSLTMAGVGYILDMASDGTTVLYSINPSKATKLQAVAVAGNVPPFATTMAAASVGNKIVTYSTSNNGAVAFNSFDTVALGWSGAGLVKPTAPPPSGSNTDGSGSSKHSVGGIVGGVVAGVVVIALIVFLFIRHRRKSTKTVEVHTAVPAQPVHSDQGKVPNTIAVPLMEQNYVLQQQQQAMVQNDQYQYQQQAYNPHHSYIPQQHDVYSAQPMSPIPVEHATSPVIFQPQMAGQEAYNYTPPTFIPQPQEDQPKIFQPHGGSEASPQLHYAQEGYVMPPTSTPLAPASQSYTPTASSHTAGSPQYIAPSNGEGYAA
ncbi:hypothetical protein BGZ99_009310 [Dissophora globulifera]|uniref:Transmembrane protein n=1 Tax=Dissophora globulifera TaxID=979702 RepID=A0A9P6UMC3_9FUNG|nr:hypothetical protein BGZ99_009310 [Dissophora globulifera]